MRNLAEEWALALVADLNETPPAWLPVGLNIHPGSTDEPRQRPCLLIHGTEEARVHPRLAAGSITMELHFHRNDGTVEAGREMLRAMAQEVDTRRATIQIEFARMTWYMPAPDEERVVDDGWVFIAVRDCRMMADSVETA